MKWVAFLSLLALLCWFVWWFIEECRHENRMDRLNDEIMGKDDIHKIDRGFEDHLRKGREP